MSTNFLISAIIKPFYINSALITIINIFEETIQLQIDHAFQ